VVVLAVVLAVLAGVLLVRATARATDRGYSKTYGASVVRYSLASDVLDRSLDEVAIVPPGNAPRPLLVLLHGRHDPSPLSWLIPSKSGPETMLSDELFYALGRLGTRAPVVVLLNGGGHSYYHDRRDGRWASMLLNEAIPDAVRRFAGKRSPVAIGGISMGGYGALHLAALRPGQFCAVGGHSAALWQNAGSSAPGAFDDTADFVRNDVFGAVEENRLAGMRVWIDGGNDDPYREADAALVAFLRRHGARVTYHLWPGGHTNAYWREHMRAYLRFYADALRSCQR